MAPTASHVGDIGATGEEFRVRTRAALPPDVVKKLSEISPVRSALSFFADWFAIVLLIALAVVTRHPLAWIVAVVGIAGAQHGLAILAHQSAHYRMFKTRWLNDLVGILSATPLGVSMHTYRIIHRIHHNHLYEPVDPDMALMAGYPRGKWYLAKKFLKDLSGLTSIKNYLYFFGKPLGAKKQPTGAKPKDDTSENLRRAARTDRRFVIVFHVAILAAAVFFGFWKFYLLLWLLPLLTVLQFLLRLRALCEHGATTDFSTPLRAARTNLVPFYIQWFLFPHQMHYHIEHHLYPAIPHYRLPECHRALREAGALDNAEVSHSFGETWRKFFAERP